MINSRNLSAKADQAHSLGYLSPAEYESIHRNASRQAA